jgi:hypothetical protein
MMDDDYYTPWEWQPIDRMPNGCCDVTVKNYNGEVRDICSCDYWWMPPERKSELMSFRETD